MGTWIPSIEIGLQMNKYIFPAAIVAAALATTSVSAATIISVNDQKSLAGDFVAGGNTLTFEFTPSEAMKIEDFAITGTGSAAALSKISFGIGSATTGFTSIVPLTTKLSGGFGSLAGFITNAPFTLVATYLGGSGTASFGFTVDTAPVPLPAAAPLLVAALGGLGIAARRKAKKSA